MFKILKPKWKEHPFSMPEMGITVPSYTAKLSRGFIKFRGVYFGSVNCWDEGYLNYEREPSGVLKWDWDITFISKKRGHKSFCSEGYFDTSKEAMKDLEKFWVELKLDKKLKKWYNIRVRREN